MALKRAELDHAIQQLQDQFKTMLDVQQKTFQACLEAFITSTNKRMDDIVLTMSTKVAELKQSVEFTQGQLDDLIKTVNTNSDFSKELNKKILTAENNTKMVTDEITILDDKLDYMENQHRRYNLRMEGIPELPNETYEGIEEQITSKLITHLKIPDGEANEIEFERVQRLATRYHARGQPSTGSPRPVLVRFTSLKDRQKILQHARKHKPVGIRIFEDFSQKIVEKRKALIPEMIRARQDGKIAFLSYDRLVVKEKPEATE